MEYVKYIESTKLLKDNLEIDIQLNKGHGRIEKRETFVITDIEMLDSIKKFKGVKSVVVTRNYRQTSEGTTMQEKYYISNLVLPAKKFGEITRKHWQIENNLHWILDVYFKEDLSTSKKNNSIHNLSLLREICYNLIKLEDFVKRKEINKRMMFYNNDLYNLKGLVFGIIPNTNQI